MVSFDYAIDYRPKRFEEVVGQEHPVAFLSGLIRLGQKGRSILIYGDHGSGKTTLVRIYAKSLNCDQPMETGSPCLHCIRCVAGDGSASGFYQFEYGKGFHVASWVEERNRTPPGGRKYIILFFDEAHLLSVAEMDSILLAVEKPKDRVIFCFATTEPERIRPTLKSRLQILEVRALSIDLALELLRRVADAEGLVYERGALALLAGLKAGHSRDLLTGLQQVGSDGHLITLERVRFVFDVDHGQVLADYFQALANGDLARQTEIIFSWREPTSEKPRWIQGCLTWLYYNKILHMPLLLDGVIDSMSTDSESIVETFCRRFDLAESSELAPYWRHMMAFWPITSRDLDDAVVHLRLTLFHHLVNEDLPSLRRKADTTRPHIAIGAEAVKPIVMAPTHGTSSWIEGSPFTMPGWLLGHSTRSSAFLRIEDARELINRASFLIQEYGVLFNATIDLCPFHFDCESESEGRTLVNEFCHELKAQVRAWRGNDKDPFAYLTLFHRADNGMQARIVVYLPRPSFAGGAGEDCVEKASAWAPQWRSERRMARVREAIRFDAGPRENTKALKFHWKATLDLCAGLSRDDMVTNEAGEKVPLLSALGLRKSTKSEAGPVDPPLIEASDALTPEAIATASRNRMEPLSAFDAQAWSVLRIGWEFKEHSDRKRTAAIRSSEVLAIEAIYGVGSEDARKALEELARQWPAKPEHRAREWIPWWPKVEA